MSYLLPGTPRPLGANWDGYGVNFALFSANAEKVELCLFEGNPELEVERIELTVTDGVWHGYLPDCAPGTHYGYRVYGPYQPEQGHRFNPNKLLQDPYARQLSGALQWHDSVFGYDVNDNLADLSFDERDSASYVAKCVVVDESFDWENDRPPRVPWPRTIIYETHVRGFTQLHQQIDKDLRGSFAAFASDPVIDYLNSLGITTVELLPVHAFIDDLFLVQKGQVNYWGYNSLSFFAAETRYLASGNRNEFKEMVKRLHRAGIEVILDVVYNHTAEGDQSGPTLSFRGIDNASYYRLPEHDKRAYINDSGCGNSLNLANPMVLKMVIDSLKHWVNDMHVDGFRFDLAVSLGREANGFSSNAAFFQAIQKDPILSKVKLIAEPWDIGPGGYQLGAFPPGWAEWNDRFRDCVRRFWHGEPGMLPDLARGLHGSSDLFEHNGRRPSASINLITSHDGFTLADLVTYNHRHNEANGENNNDGHGANFSNNYGVEGPSDGPELVELRQRQCRNLLATIFLAQGTPMLLAGDELGRSQQGNNNAYCQDNELNWQDWSADLVESKLFNFVQELIRIRARYPLLHRDRFVHGEEQFEPTGFTDIQWLGANGQSMQEPDWHNHQNKFLAMLLAGEVLPARNLLFDDGKDAALVIVFNADIVPIKFVLPESQFHWRCVFTTADKQPAVTEHFSVEIKSRSVQLFELQM
jgi:isoamylase